MQLNITQANDVRITNSSTAAEVLSESLEVLQTNGEWELANISVGASILTLDSGNYSEVTYYVSSFENCDDLAKVL